MIPFTLLVFISHKEVNTKLSLFRFKKLSIMLRKIIIQQSRERKVFIFTGDLSLIEYASRQLNKSGKQIKRVFKRRRDNKR